MSISRFLILTLPLLSCLRWFLAYPGLPEEVAIHWGFSGPADGYKDKFAAALLMNGTVVFMAVVFLGLQKLIRIFPGAINIPNRDYWLAPERREATIDEVAGFLDKVGALTVVFMTLVGHFVLVANGRPDHSLPPAFLVVFISFLLVIVVAAVRFSVRFNAKT